MKHLKTYEYFDKGFEFEDIDLMDIVSKAPNTYFVIKHTDYVKNELKKFIGKSVSFVTFFDSDTRRIMNGVVEDVSYNYEGLSTFYFKLKNDPIYHIVLEDEITIHVTATNINKYNI